MLPSQAQPYILLEVARKKESGFVSSQRKMGISDNKKQQSDFVRDSRCSCITETSFVFVNTDFRVALAAHVSLQSCL